MITARGRDRSRARGHGGASARTLYADFTGASVGALTTLPGGLTLTRASGGTVQTSDQTVTVGIGVDVARVGQRTSSATVRGLVFEEGRTNGQHRSCEIDGWTASGVAGGTTRTADAGAAPDGTTTADEVNWASGGSGFNGYFTTGVGSAPAAYSLWVKHAAGRDDSMMASSAADGLGVINTTGATKTWTRYTVASAGNGGYGVQASGALVPRALVWGVQTEGSAKFSTELIVTTGAATAARSGERLYYAAGSALVDAGRLALEVKAIPKGARASYTAAIRLWTSGTDYAEIDQTTGVMTVSIGGSTNTTAAITWSQYDVLEMFVAAGGGVATVVKYRVNGGAVSTPAITGSALGTLTVASALDLLCSTTTKQLSAWVQTITCWRSNRAPGWAS